MPQVESLTIQILGDSSGLQQELQQVADLLDGLQQELGSASDQAQEFGNAFGGLSAALGPLQAVQGQLSGISQLLQQLANQPVTLNVEPALGSLSQLLQAAQAVAAQLAQLGAAAAAGSAFPALGEGMLPAEAAVGTTPRGFAGGGLVSGPPGIDRVSARLTAGEYVLNPSLVQSLGTGRLDRWNRSGTIDMPSVAEPAQRVVAEEPANRERISATGRAAAVAAGTSTQQTLNHFGGIEIHVRETADVDLLMQDLRRQGIGLRHRRG